MLNEFLYSCKINKLLSDKHIFVEFTHTRYTIQISQQIKGKHFVF